MSDPHGCLWSGPGGCLEAPGDDEEHAVWDERHGAPDGHCGGPAGPGVVQLQPSAAAHTEPVQDRLRGGQPLFPLD